MLDQITPVILTFNEAPNIARTLSRLAWANDIVVVDSFSSDDTLAILAGFPKVRVFSRRFDTHAGQWQFATGETGITTPWILRLDADYQLSDALIAELSSLSPPAGVGAYRISFEYAIYSRPLRCSLYPSNTVLLRKGCFSVTDRGHTESWHTAGAIAALNGRIIHDDWKTTRHWGVAQTAYMALEAERLAVAPKGLRDWLRLHPPLMPVAAFFYCLFGRGLILNGKAGLYYALQRLVAEALLSLMLIERKLKRLARPKH